MKTSLSSLLKRAGSALCSAALAATALLPATPALAATSTGTVDYPETLLGAFWTSDSDQTDTLYLSTDGINFERICTPYPSRPGANGLVNGTDHIYTLHDPGLFYTPNNQTFWLISGYVDNGAFRYMAGCSQDLREWSWPDPANGERFYPTVAPDMGGHTTAQGFNTAGTDATCDPDGSTVWVVTSLGFYANHNGMDSQYDVMHPYIMKVSNLSPNVDISEGHYDWHGLAPLGSNGPLQPINLPDEDISSNWIDPSLYYEDGWWYLSIKAWGIQNRIYRIQDLNRASDPNAWSIWAGNVCTGFEGASMTKLNFNASYYTYVDKLADYYTHNDGTTGVFAFRSPYVSSRNDWTNLGRIVTKDEFGSRIANRHGSVLNIKDPHALEVVWGLHDSLYRHGEEAHWQDEWVDVGGGNWYVYKHGQLRTDSWIELRGDWYYVGRDGQMLADKQWLDFQGTGAYYFFNPNHDGTYGKMRIDWFLNPADGFWYYMEPEAGTGKQGMVVTGDRWIGGKLYHFDGEGRCLNP